MKTKEVGKIIAEAREKAELSQQELAQKMRVSNDKISRIESGELKIKPRFLKKLNKVIEIDYCELMYMIGYGMEVSPLNSFIKDYYYNLKFDELDSSKKTIMFKLNTDKQAINTLKKIVEEYKLNDYEKSLLIDVIDNLEYQNNTSKEIIKLIKSMQIRRDKK